VSEVVRSGTTAALEELLRAHPTLVDARFGRGQARTLLHLITDWPGHVPHAAAKIRAVVAAGADVNAPYTGPQHCETPLYWAASSDESCGRSWKSTVASSRRMPSRN
jgi:uncharacterized protein